MYWPTLSPLLCSVILYLLTLIGVHFRVLVAYHFFNEKWSFTLKKSKQKYEKKIVGVTRVDPLIPAADRESTANGVTYHNRFRLE